MNLRGFFFYFSGVRDADQNMECRRAFSGEDGQFGLGIGMDL